MANSPQARKRARQNVTRRTRNMGQRSSLRSSIKKLLKLISENNISENNKDKATTAYRDAVSAIDRAVSKNLHHKNRAARLKSRLNNRLKSISA